MTGPVVPVQDSIVIGISRLISNTSGMGAQKVEKVANAWKYQCDYQLRAKSKRPWMVGTRQIGQATNWMCNCSKQGPPGMQIEAYHRYNLGLDRVYESIVLGQNPLVKLIEKKGAWYAPVFLMKEPSLLKGEAVPNVQGEENLYKLFQANPAWAEALENELRKAAGSLSVGGGE